MKLTDPCGCKVVSAFDFLYKTLAQRNHYPTNTSCHTISGKSRTDDSHFSLDIPDLIVSHKLEF